MILALTLSAALLNPEVRQDTIAATICRPGYAASVRPPAGYARAIKRSLLHGRNPRAFTLDHRVPLSLGGAPRWPNLQLQTVAEAKRKDRLEAALHASVCRHTVSLRDAQLRMEAWR